ncbi:MAG: tetratricopeptide repeat protein [Candidatus Lokiarchaeota archaeon]|nr:tetratricopeptide repeat protein [Candidatus Lokiarchaeota archaeon]
MICPSCDTRIHSLVSTCPVCQFELLTLIKTKETTNYYFNLALDAYNESKYYDALESLILAHNFNPADTEVLNLLAYVYVKLNQYKKAITYFSKVLKVDAKNKDTQQALLWLQSNGYEISINNLF